MITYEIISGEPGLYNGQVIALLKDTFEDADHQINNCIKRVSSQSKMVLKMKQSYTGQSSCKPEDTPDFEIGKRIAKDRLLIKYYDDKIADIITYCKWLDDILQNLYQVYQHNFNTRALYVEDLEKLGLDR